MLCAAPACASISRISAAVGAAGSNLLVVSRSLQLRRRYLHHRIRNRLNPHHRIRSNLKKVRIVAGTLSERRPLRHKIQPYPVSHHIRRVQSSSNPFFSVTCSTARAGRQTAAIHSTPNAHTVALNPNRIVT